jgi:prepilin-type N-terminal cleavage/methylation domain-containing protein
MSQSFKNQLGRACRQAGFSLTELLVTLSIVGVLMTVILTSQGTYSDVAGLTAVADEIAITVSQAQAYGIAVREKGVGTANFTGAYGLSVSLLPSGSGRDYLSFGDLNGNFIYDGTWACTIGTGLECLGKTTLTTSYYIDGICIIPNSGADICYTVGRIDASFTRPDTDARLVFFNPSGANMGITSATARGAKLILRSQRGAFRYVSIYFSGQVSVQ